MTSRGRLRVDRAAALGGALLLLVGAAVACGPRRYGYRGPTVSSVPEPPRPAVRGVGPLSLRAEVPETPWPLRQELSLRADSLYLDREAIEEDGRQFLKLVDQLFPRPPTPEMATGVEVARREMDLLARLAPYSLESVASSFGYTTERLPLCARSPGVTRHCWLDLVPAEPPEGPPFELTDAAPGVALLALRDLSDGADPGWSELPEALAEIGGARALVLDMRAAVGTDPRPLLPLLEELTGRAPLRPLRAINRPPELDPYVADYAERYIAESRDRAVWAGLVGTIPPAREGTAPPPIAVVVGPGCGAACELAARVLETYTGATLFGAVQAAGRLERDEPARLALPRSRVEIYFYASEYLLADDIERATGPTAEWYARLRETYEGDLVAFAATELEERLAGHERPRCDSYPTYAAAEELTPALREKLPSAGVLGFPCSRHIELRSTAPLSALRRFAATCPRPIELQSAHGTAFSLPSDLTLPALSQLAASELVERIDVECEQEMHLL